MISGGRRLIASLLLSTRVSLAWQQPPWFHGIPQRFRCWGFAAGKRHLVTTTTTRLAMTTTTTKFPDDFPSVAPYFGDDDNSKTPLVGLLFSAGWCPDCRPVIRKLAADLQASNSDDNKKQVEFVYVSSEASADEMKDFLAATGGDAVFSSVPYSNVEERAALKRHFQACAQKELAQVGLLTSRKHGIPTLKLFSRANASRVVSEDAVPDLEALSYPEAVQKWLGLLHNDKA